MMSIISMSGLIQKVIPNGKKITELTEQSRNISGHLAQLVRATRLHRVGRGFESLSAHFGLMPEGLSAGTLLQKMKKVNQKDRNWEPGSHEDPQNPGVYKKVLVRQEEADPDSKLMMFQLCKIPPKTTHVAHSHPTMDEIFYFTEGKGEIEVDGEKEKIVSGDRIIVPAGQVHQIRNTGKVELKFIGLGVALD